MGVKFLNQFIVKSVIIQYGITHVNKLFPVCLYVYLYKRFIWDKFGYGNNVHTLEEAHAIFIIKKIIVIQNVGNCIFEILLYM